MNREKVLSRKLERPIILFLAIALSVSICLNVYLNMKLRNLNVEYRKLCEELENYRSAPAQYVETYKGWIIIKVKNYFHPPAMHHEWIYVAIKDECVIFGIDLPDLIADIDEASSMSEK